MKSLILAILVFFIALPAGAQRSIEKQWELTGLESPESVIPYDNHLYVSNVSGQPGEKNGMGFISKVDATGKLVKLKWVAGFNAPKGLGVFRDKLYVADIDQVVVVNLKTAEIERRLPAAGATFLNDVEVSPTGVVYISDTFGGNAVYQIRDGEISLLLKDDRLDYPNGLKLVGNSLYVATWGVVTDPQTFGTEIPGKVVVIDLNDNSITDLTATTGNLDGLVRFKRGFIASDWIAGKLLSISRKGEVKELKDLNAGSADIAYLRKQKLLLVPQMMDGKLTAYKLR